MKKTRQFFISLLAINILLLNLAFIPLPATASSVTAPVTMIAQESFFDTYIFNPVKDLFGIDDGEETASDPSEQSEEDDGQATAKSESEIKALTPQITEAVYQDGKAYIEWEPVKSEDFINYELERSINDYGWNNVATITDPALTFFNDQPGSQGNSIKYRLITNADLSYTSDVVYARDDAFKIIKSEIDPTGAGYLEWSPPAQGASEYTIYSSINNAAYKVIDKKNGDWYYYRDELVIGQKNLNILQYKISAKLADGSTVTTDPVTVLNQAPDLSINPNLTTATFYSEGYVNLQWSKPTQASNEVIYEIWRSTTGDYFYPVNQNVNQLYYLDNLGSYASYDTLAYKILAVDQGQVGESNVLYAKDSSFELKSADLVGSFAYLEWSTPAQPVTSYEVFRTYDQYVEGATPNLTKIATPASSHYYYQDNSVDLSQDYVAYQVKANIANFGPAYTAIIYVKESPAPDDTNPEPTTPTNTGGYNDYYTSGGRSGLSIATGIATAVLGSLILGGSDISPQAPADYTRVSDIARRSDIWRGSQAGPGFIDYYERNIDRLRSTSLERALGEYIAENPDALDSSSNALPQDTKDLLLMGYQQMKDARDANNLPSNAGEGILEPWVDVNGNPTDIYVDKNGNVYDTYGNPVDDVYVDDNGNLVNGNGDPVSGVGGAGNPGGLGATGSGVGSAATNVSTYKDYMAQFNPWEGKDSLVEVIGAILNLAIIMAGLIAVGFIVFGGYLYITSGGNPEKSKRATEAVTYAAIGLVVVLAAYLIVDTVLQVLGGTTSF